MKFYQFIRIYAGYGLVYISYKTSFYILNKLFSMVDEIIESDPNVSNNTNDGAMKTCKENVRGIMRDQTALIKALKHVKRFGDKAISTIIKPIASIIGYVLLKFPALKRVYRVLKSAKIIISSCSANNCKV